LNPADLADKFTQGLLSTGWMEGIAVAAGIISVWFSKKESIWVYPTGLVNTTLYVYLSARGDLYGEAAVNFYYTLMSLYGWHQWTKKDSEQNKVAVVSFSNKRWMMYQWFFFIMAFLTLFISLQILKNNFAKDAIPWADALASAAAFTGMWLMTKKKVESWFWWIATNILSIPLYTAKGYVFTGFYYLILLLLAFSGLQSWRKKAIDQ